MNKQRKQTKSKDKNKNKNIGLLCLVAQRNSIVTTSKPPWASLISQQSARVTPRTTTYQFTSTRKTVMLFSAEATSTQTAVPVITASKCVGLHVRRKSRSTTKYRKIEGCEQSFKSRKYTLIPDSYFHQCISTQS